MSQYVINGSLAFALALATSFQLCPYAQAQQASVSESSQTVVGPAQVIDSYMKPTVVRTRESTDSDGTVEKTVEPIVQERHERVMVPSLETTSTDTRSAATTVVKTEAHHVAQTTSAPVAVRHSSHHRRHQAHSTAQKYVHHDAVASRVTTIVQPATIEHHETTTERQTIVDRKDPSLDP